MSKQGNKVILPLIATVLFIITFMTLGFYSYLIFNTIYPESITSAPNSLSDFGEQFGWVNTLFSGAAFVALIYTIFAQREDINSQENSLKEQGEQLKEQGEHLKRLANETTFFNILQRMDMVVQQIKVPEHKAVNSSSIDAVPEYTTIDHTGQNAIKYILKLLMNEEHKNIDFARKSMDECSNVLNPFLCLFEAAVDFLYNNFKEDSRLGYSKLLAANLTKSQKSTSRLPLCYKAKR